MINSQFSRHVASLESREGCPITPGASLSKTFYLVPLARSNKDIRGHYFNFLQNLKIISRCLDDKFKICCSNNNVK